MSTKTIIPYYVCTVQTTEEHRSDTLTYLKEDHQTNKINAHSNFINLDPDDARLVLIRHFDSTGRVLIIHNRGDWGSGGPL